MAASIDIDASGALTYDTDGTTAEVLRISESSGVYTFSSDRPIDVESNLAGLPTSGDGTTTVEVTMPSRMVVNLSFDGDGLTVASVGVPAAVNLKASNLLVTLGDAASSQGLASILGAVVVTGAPGKSGSVLTLDDYAGAAETAYTIMGTTATADDGFAGLTYFNVPKLVVRGAWAYGSNFRVLEQFL